MQPFCDWVVWCKIDSTAACVVYNQPAASVFDYGQIFFVIKTRELTQLVYKCSIGLYFFIDWCEYALSVCRPYWRHESKCAVVESMIVQHGCDVNTGPWV